MGKRRWTCIELFTGGGGLALGASLAGVNNLLSVERDPNSCKTLRENAGAVYGCPGGENMFITRLGRVRYYTVREAARLQTFPDDYVFLRNDHQSESPVELMNLPNPTIKPKPQGFSLRLGPEWLAQLRAAWNEDGWTPLKRFQAMAYAYLSERQRSSSEDKPQ